MIFDADHVPEPNFLVEVLPHFQDPEVAFVQSPQYLFTGTHYLLSLAMLTFTLLPATYLLLGLSPIRADGWTWALHYLPFYGMVLLVTWLQSGGFKASAIVASIGAAPVHSRALLATLGGGTATWRVTNGRGGSTRSLWAVMPIVALLVLNVTAIAVGVVVMADPAPTWLSVAWAGMHVLILGRMIIAAVAGAPRTAPEPGTTTAVGVAPLKTEARS